MQLGRIWTWLILSFLLVVIWLTCDERLRQLLTTTCIVSISAAVFAVAVGTFLAVVFLRTNLLGRSAGPWLLGGLLFLPLYVHVAGWETVLGRFGWWSTLNGPLQSPWLSGLAAVVLIHTVAAIPWGVLFAAAGLATIDPAWEEGAACDASGLVVLKRITLPALAPNGLFAGLWIATLTAGEMTVTNIYQVRTYAEEIYTNFAQEAALSATFKNAAPGLMLLALVAAAMFLLLPRLIPATTRSRWPGSRVWPLGRFRWPISLFTWSLLGILVFVPVVSLLYKTGIVVLSTPVGLLRSWSLTKAATLLTQAPADHYSEGQSTLAIAVTTALVTLPVVLLPAWWGGTSGGRMVPWLFLLPAFIPGPLVGVLVIVLLNRPEFPGGLLIKLYDDTIAAPVLATLPRTIPITGLLLWTAFLHTPRDLRDLAQLQASSRTRQAWLLIGGTHRKVLGAAFLASLAIAAGELACTILVLPPGVSTISFRVFQLLHSGCDDRLAALCLVQFAATAACGGLIATLVRK